jgi:Pectate lyase superfamily protein
MTYNPVNVKDYGAVGDGVTDDTAAIQSAVTAANALESPHLIVPDGIYRISSVTFDLPDGSRMDFVGSFVTDVSGDTAVRIGSSTASRFYYNVSGLKVVRDVADATTDSVGVELVNLYGCNIDTRRIANFHHGLKVFGNDLNTLYNQIFLGFLYDNTEQLWVTALDNEESACNEMIFYGGRFGYSGDSYPEVNPGYVGTILIRIDHVASNFGINNIRFIAPSLEALHANTKAAVINGTCIVIKNPRWENGANQYGQVFEFTSSSTHCAIEGVGVGVYASNVDDSGSHNSFCALDGDLLARDVVGGAGHAALTLQTQDNGAQQIRGITTTGAETWAIRQDGIGVFGNRVYADQGLRWSTSNGSLNDRGIFVGSGTPEGVVAAFPGSLYVNINGGAGDTVFAKETGFSSTGWVRLVKPVTQPDSTATTLSGLVADFNTLLAALR